MQKNLASIFFTRALALSERPGVRYKEGREPYKDMTWSAFSELVSDMAYGLASLGLEKGERAAILSPTSHLWVAADLSIMANGAASVPVYPTSSTGDIEFILHNSESQFVFVHNEALLSKVLSVRERLPHLKRAILTSPLPAGRSLADLGGEPGSVISIEELCEYGRVFRKREPGLVESRYTSTTFEELATIIYTSGTTGTPKGVMLTHANIIGVIEDLPKVIPIDENDVYLSFLPLSHVFERICGEFYWIQSGGICAFAEGIEHVAKNMAETSPTMILVVPRVLDKIYAKVKSGIQGASPRARTMIEWSLAVAQEIGRHASIGQTPRPGLKAKHWLAERLVLGKLRNRIGSRLRLVVSGGAPATREVIQFFNAVGILTVEGYGLTETSAPASVNLAHKIKPGTVGPVLPSVEVKLAEDGEILLKGPGVFSGYFKADEQTAAVFTDGWFHTGDIGVVDGDGYITITDRKKDIIVNSAGKNIAPQRVEAILRMVPFVTQAIVFGDKKKTLAALLTLDEHAVIEFAREKGWNFSEFSDLVRLPELHQTIKTEINERSGNLADYEQVRSFAILPQDLSVEAGELTATMKVKRNVVAAKYKELIDSLYKREKEPKGSGLISSKR